MGQPLLPVGSSSAPGVVVGAEGSGDSVGSIVKAIGLARNGEHRAGDLVPIPAFVNGEFLAERIGLAVLHVERLVKVHALNEPLPENGLYSNAMAGTDRMELYSTVNAAGDQMMLVSLFDNLGKGSSGAAVQCMNLMLGLPETQGLE